VWRCSGKSSQGETKLRYQWRNMQITVSKLRHCGI